MKNFIWVLMFVLFACSCVAHADASYPVSPEWREICPSLYLSIDANGDYVLPEKQYWAKRRKSFEQSKHFCSHSYEYDLEKLSDCYYILKKSEKRKTQDFQMVQKQKNTAPNVHYQGY